MNLMYVQDGMAYDMHRVHGHNVQYNYRDMYGTSFGIELLKITNSIHNSDANRVTEISNIRKTLGRRQISFENINRTVRTVQIQIRRRYSCVPKNLTTLLLRGHNAPENSRNEITSRP